MYIVNAILPFHIFCVLNSDNGFMPFGSPDGFSTNLYQKHDFHNYNMIYEYKGRYMQLFLMQIKL